MNRAVPQGRPPQTPQRSASVPPNSTRPATSSPLSNASPSFPKGQMPIEEVFKMMWSRMNFLENALNEKGVSTEGDQTTIANLKNNTVIPESIQKQLDENTSKINTLAQEVGSLKKTIITTVTNFNQSMQAVGADLTEMNNKYTQMNNFLMEIQTTQITVNNKILKHYNDNYSDLLESHIEKRANEKFIASGEVSTSPDVKTTSVAVETDSVTVATNEPVEDTGIENTTIEQETEYTAAPPYDASENSTISVVEETIARGEAEQETNTEETLAVNSQLDNIQVDENESQPNTNNVTFNIE